MTTVWLFKPRSHGRKKEAIRARNGAPLPGRCNSSERLVDKAFYLYHQGTPPQKFQPGVGTLKLYSPKCE